MQGGRAVFLHYLQSPFHSSLAVMEGEALERVHHTRLDSPLAASPEQKRSSVPEEVGAGKLVIKCGFA